MTNRKAKKIAKSYGLSLVDYAALRYTARRKLESRKANRQEGITMKRYDVQGIVTIPFQIPVRDLFTTEKEMTEQEISDYVLGRCLYTVESCFDDVESNYAGLIGNLQYGDAYWEVLECSSQNDTCSCGEKLHAAWSFCPKCGKEI